MAKVKKPVPIGDPLVWTGIWDIGAMGVNPLQTAQNNTPTMSAWTSKGFVQTQPNPVQGNEIWKETPIIDNQNEIPGQVPTPVSTEIQIPESERARRQEAATQREKWLWGLSSKEAGVIQTNFEERQKSWGKTKDQIVDEMRTDLQQRPEDFEKIKAKYLSKPENIPWTPEANQKMLQSIQKTLKSSPELLNNEGQFKQLIGYDQMNDAQKAAIDNFYKTTYSKVNDKDALFKKSMSWETVTPDTKEGEQALMRRQQLNYVNSLSAEQLGSKLADWSILSTSREIQDLQGFNPTLYEQAQRYAQQKQSLNSINKSSQSNAEAIRKSQDNISKVKKVDIPPEKTALQGLNESLVSKFSTEWMSKEDAEAFKASLSESPAIVEQASKLNAKMAEKDRLNEAIANLPQEASEMMGHDAPAASLKSFINQRTRVLNEQMRGLNLDISAEQWALNILTDREKEVRDKYKTFRGFSKEDEKFEYQKEQDIIQNRFRQQQLDNDKFGMFQDTQGNQVWYNKSTNETGLLRTPWTVVTASGQSIPFSQVSQSDPTTQKNSLVQFANNNLGMTYKRGGKWDGTIDCSGLITNRATAAWFKVPGSGDAQSLYNASTEKPLTDLTNGDLIYYKDDQKDQYGRNVTHVWVALWPVQDWTIRVLDASSNLWKVGYRDVKVSKDGRLVGDGSIQVLWANNPFTQWPVWWSTAVPAGAKEFYSDQSGNKVYNLNSKDRPTDKASLAATALIDINDMKKVLKKPEFWVWSFYSNIPYNQLYENITDKIGRMRSGGAITIDEENRFKRLLGTIYDVRPWADFSETLYNKLWQLQREFEIFSQGWGLQTVIQNKEPDTYSKSWGENSANPMGVNAALNIMNQ